MLRSKPVLRLWQPLMVLHCATPLEVGAAIRKITATPSPSREFRELAGSKADIYQTMHDGKLAFLVATGKKVDNCCLQTPEINTESRLSTLENKIKS